jgi:hypothetical protein
LEDDDLEYLVGTSLRQRSDIRLRILGQAGRFPDSAEIKEITLDGVRHILYRDPGVAAEDAAGRELVLAAAKEQPTMSIDPAWVKADALFDGLMILRTNTNLTAEEVVSQYRRRDRIPEFFGRTTTALQARSIRQHPRALVRGQLMCGLLSLVLIDELERRLASAGHSMEWGDLRPAIEELVEVKVAVGLQDFVLGSKMPETTEMFVKLLGIELPPPVQP